MSSVENDLFALGAILRALDGQSVAEMPWFEACQIADAARSMGQTSLPDDDRDGDPDWQVGQAAKLW